MISSLQTRIKRKIMQRLLPNDFYFRVAGYCPCCDRMVEFVSYHPWLRDHFLCGECSSVPRNRALMYVLQKHFPKWPDMTIHESSPSAGGASATLKRECANYISSQYFPSRTPGEIIDGHGNENLALQTFPDATFDLVITQDVLEHVYEPGACFKEISRTLKPGGAHVFNLPIVNKHRETQVWALPGPDGEPKFLYEPEFHGNPIDHRGAPVTMHWGFDIVEHIRDACGLETTIEYVDELAMGIRAECIEVLVTRKPLAPSASI